VATGSLSCRGEGTRLCRGAKTGETRHHTYLVSQMVPAMHAGHLVGTYRFPCSAESGGVPAGAPPSGLWPAPIPNQAPGLHPASLSLGVAGRDMSWHALPMHLRHKASTPEASRATVAQAWTRLSPRPALPPICNPSQWKTTFTPPSPIWRGPIQFPRGKTGAFPLLMPRILLPCPLWRILNFNLVIAGYSNLRGNDIHSNGR
jgi:hypothetical protein